MIRLAFALVLLAGLVPPAFATELGGVWRGSLGKQAIVACFDDNSGDYYYESRRYSIPLWSDEGAVSSFKEGSDYNQPTGAWRILNSDATSLEAEWKSPDGKRSYPIRLHRIAGGAGKDGICSELDAYNEPRVSRVGRGPATPSLEHGVPVAKETALNLDVERLQLQSPDAAGARINARLDAEYRRKLGQAYSCMSNNEKGDFSAVMDVEVATTRWLVVDTGADWFCGGPHPDESVGHLVFDRRDGHQVDTSQWWQTDDEARRDALWQLLAKKAAPDGECAEVWKDRAGDLHLYPAAGGVAVAVDLPHIALPCDDDVQLTVDEARPFLTEAALRALAPGR